MGSFAGKTRRGNGTKMNLKYLTFAGPGTRPEAGSRQLWTWATIGVILLGLVIGISVLVTGCTQPTALERRVYAVETNTFPVSVTTVAGSNGVEYVTNYGSSYVLEPKPAVESVVGLAGLFGPTGELIGAIVAAALVGWAHYRNRKSAQLAEVLAQNIAIGRAALQETPEGRALDEKWRDLMIVEQTRAGVLPAAGALVRRSVDSAAARLAARRYLTRPS
jgi:hypothetical protein